MIEGSRFASDHTGFCSARLSADMLSFAIIDHTGATLHSAEIRARA
jgi:hypothetical protein